MSTNFAAQLIKLSTTQEGVNEVTCRQGEGKKTTADASVQTEDIPELVIDGTVMPVLSPGGDVLGEIIGTLTMYFFNLFLLLCISCGDIRSYHYVSQGIIAYI